MRRRWPIRALGKDGGCLRPRTPLRIGRDRQTVHKVRHPVEDRAKSAPGRPAEWFGWSYAFANKNEELSTKRNVRGEWSRLGRVDWKQDPLRKKGGPKIIVSRNPRHRGTASAMRVRSHKRNMGVEFLTKHEPGRSFILPLFGHEWQTYRDPWCDLRSHPS